MKRLLPLIALSLLFIKCKTGNTVTPIAPQLDVVGTWSLYSWQQPDINATDAQYPCLADNVLKVNADNTASITYNGTSTCYVSPPNTPLNESSSIGVPGQAAINSTWRRSGNDIYIGANHYIISTLDNQLYLSYTDTLTAGYTTPQILKVLDIKQQ